MIGVNAAMSHSLRLASMLIVLCGCAFLEPRASAMDLTKPQPEQGLWYCESDTGQSTVYMSGIEETTAMRKEVEAAYAHSLTQSLGYKGAAICYVAQRESDRTNRIKQLKDYGKTIVETRWTPSAPTIAPVVAPAAPAASATPAAPSATTPPTASRTPTQTPAHREPYVCVANFAASGAESSTAAFYVTEPFQSATPPPGIIQAWRSYLATQYHVSNADVGNCSRRDQARRDQLEAQIAKVKGPVVRVSWAP